MIEIRWLAIRNAIADAVFSSTTSLKRPYEGAVEQRRPDRAGAAYAKDGGVPVPRRFTVKVGNEVRRPPHYP